ncbi:MAG: carboxypeptidase-like regulatory domain-containing protein, partial [Mameliella sp.]|nr:carboxypeptidase-like regulatory domain-containing protein [Phaeodactylibacter sp.]
MDNLVKKLIFSLLMLFMLQDISAQILISGKVTESDGAPLPWATVVVKGTDNGTETKNDGSYSIEVPDENSVLVFSFLGYGSEEVTVGERRTIDVVLGSDSQLLSEVVIVGYGTQKKSDVTGAIVSVESEDLEKVSVVNAVSALQGKAAGVSITSNSGTPGGSVKVRVRGIGTT